jgi:lipooligosaccharide transport system permease protein
VYRRIWRSSIWSSVLGPLFYLGALGFGLGSLVDRHGTASLGGVTYLAFVAPAILASSAMNTAMGEASYPVFGSVKWKSWQDFDYVILASMPLFLFSTTFYPLSVYPRAVQVIVEYTPLYQGVVLLRDLTVGVVGPDLLWRAAYLAVLGLAGLYISGRRLARLLLV